MSMQDKLCNDFCISPQECVQSTFLKIFVVWKVMYEKWFVCEKSCEQVIRSFLPTKGISYYFPSHLEIVLFIPLVGR